MAHKLRKRQAGELMAYVYLCPCYCLAHGVHPFMQSTTKKRQQLLERVSGATRIHYCTALCWCDVNAFISCPLCCCHRISLSTTTPAFALCVRSNACDGCARHWTTAEQQEIEHTRTSAHTAVNVYIQCEEIQLTLLPHLFGYMSQQADPWQPPVKQMKMQLL